MVDYNFSSDTRQDKMMAVSMENYNYITSDTGKDKTDWHSVLWSTISVLTLDKTKLNGNKYGESNYQL